MTPSERTTRARIGGHSLHAKHDSRVVSAPGRKAAAEALDARLLQDIDPENQLSEAERSRRLEHARRAHFLSLALKSAQTRKKRKATG
jgi:hypothetical protein